MLVIQVLLSEFKLNIIAGSIYLENDRNQEWDWLLAWPDHNYVVVKTLQI